MNLAQSLQLAFAAAQRGDWPEAERLSRASLEAKADCFEALHLLGVIAGQAGRPAEAADWFARAIAVEPRHPDTHFNRGVALAELNRPMEALAAYERAVALDASKADAHFNRGVLLASLGRHAEAIDSYSRVVALDPKRAEAHHNLGVSLAEASRPAEGLASIERAISLAPGNAAAHNSRGVVLAAVGRHEEAVASYRQALALRPEFAGALSNLGTALTELGRPDQGLASCERALALAPDMPDAHYHRANALRDLGRHTEAVASYERAIELRPEHAGAHWNLADCLLLLGDFERGWKEYEWRWRLASRRREARAFTQPLWTGDDRLEGRTILLHSELGLGDTLQFCRYASEVARRGARVLLEVQAPLAGLLRGLEGVAQVIVRGEPLPAFDLHCPIMSLPLAFRTDAGSVPAAIPYLRAQQDRRAVWQAKLSGLRAPRIGLVWSGSRGLRNDKRSMRFTDAEPLLDLEAGWVSLQKEVPPEDAADLLRRRDLRQAGPELADFSDTAAALEPLDLLVTVDTSIAHLAGAMGKRVWILLPLRQHDWRWQLERQDSPWYPTARLFRQERDGDWAELVARVLAELRRLPR